MVSLRPLRDDEYDAWDAAHGAEYERQLVEFAGLSREAARDKARQDVAAVLPRRLATPETWIWAIEEDGRRVGTMFLGLRGGEAFLYDVTIDAAERGRGLGRAAMLALEDRLRELGHTTAELNVWGGNDIARGLYRSLGYVEQSVRMRKQL